MADLRVLLVDDHEVVRMGLRLVLDEMLQRAAARTPGVELRRGALVTRMACGADGVQVTLEDVEEADSAVSLL